MRLQLSSIKRRILEVCYHHLLRLIVAGTGIDTVSAFAVIPHPEIHMKPLTVTVGDERILIVGSRELIIRISREVVQAEATVILAECYGLISTIPFHNKSDFIHTILYRVSMQIIGTRIPQLECKLGIALTQTLVDISTGRTGYMTPA